MEVIIVPCTQEKVWDSQPDLGAVPAKDAYTKAAFRVWRSHAERSGGPWFILSTKYGLLQPDQLIEKYNVAVSAAVGDAGLLSRLDKQGQEFGLGSVGRVVLLDWERFQPLVRAATRSLSVKCVLRKVQY
jgi:hypothetical protein